MYSRCQRPPGGGAGPSKVEVQATFKPVLDADGLIDVNRTVEKYGRAKKWEPLLTRQARETTCNGCGRLMKNSAGIRNEGPDLANSRPRESGQQISAAYAATRRAFAAGAAC